MKQATIRLKTSIQNVHIMNNNVEVSRVILNSMLMILGFLTILYITTLGNTVFNIVARKSLEKEALALTNEVGNLELSYLSLSNHVDLAMSASMGFKENKPTFATRKALGSLKMSPNEI